MKPAESKSLNTRPPHSRDAWRADVSRSFRGRRTGRLRARAALATAGVLVAIGAGYFTPASAAALGTSGETIWTVAGQEQLACPALACGIGGLATGAELSSPSGVADDSAGDIAIADPDERVVDFVPATSGTFFGRAMTAGHIYTLAGELGLYCTEDCGENGAPADASQLKYPSDVAFDGKGDVIFADSSDDTIRFVPATSGTYYGQPMTAGDIYTIAGSSEVDCAGVVCGDEGPATSAQLKEPSGVASDAAGDIYIADSFDDAIRFVPAISGTYYGQTMTAGDIYTIAGRLGKPCGGGSCGNGELAVVAELEQPERVAVDAAGDVAIADAGDDIVRFLPVAKGEYFAAAMSANHLYTVAGEARSACTTAPCGDNHPATAAGVALDFPSGVAFGPQGEIVIADTEDESIRSVSERSDVISLLAGIEKSACELAPCGDGGSATRAELFHPEGIAAYGDDGFLVADAYDAAIRWLTGPQAGPEGAEGEPGKEGPEGKPGKEGAEGKPGKEGKEGAEGREGKAGAPGKIELVECAPAIVHRKHVKKCKTRSVSGTVKFTTGFSEHPAELIRKARVIARGEAYVRGRDVSFVSAHVGGLGRGTYRLAFSVRSGRRWTTRRVQILID